MEAYNGFARSEFFGGEGVIAGNDPEEREQVSKHTGLVVNALSFQNVADQTRALQEMAAGHPGTREDVAVLSPSMTGHIKRFGDYVLDLTAPPHR